ncbi:MAG: SPASM domain-containing protein [Planctomycetaceae bacterium]|nr:SPASM domain-containing protein [Planctomycetaceae bacterium]
MSAIVDAYIEIPASRESRDAFVGDGEFSPFNLLLKTLVATPELRYIVLPWDDSWGKIPVVNDRVKIVKPGAISDIAARDVGKAMRAWNHTGSLHGTLMSTAFCAYGNPAQILDHLPRPHPRYVLSLTGHHAFITRETIASTLRVADENGWIQAFYTCDGPLGMIPILVDVFVLDQMARSNTLPQSVFFSMGRFWGYMLGHTPTNVVQCRRAFELATQRGRSFCAAVGKRLRACGALDAETLSATAVVEAGNAEFDAWAGELPQDVEIEITTDRDIEPVYLPKLSRPRAAMSFELFRKIVTQFEPHKDSINLTLGGFGDPLNHPELAAFLKTARPYVRALNIRTFGTRLTEDVFQEFVNTRVDTVNVRFGYWGKEQYLKANNADLFEELSTRILGIRDKQAEHGGAMPFFVPEVVKGLPGDKTLVDFRDEWYKRMSWPVVTSYNTFGGAVEPQQAINLYPGVRKPCYKITEQMIVHADGRVPLCWQDYDCRIPAGDLNAQSVTGAWRGELMRKVRASHQEGDYARHNSGCAKCNEWFRLS